MFPCPSMAIWEGEFSWAALAGPPSPLNPACPVPAIVWDMPSAVTLRMRCLPRSAIYRLPDASNSTPNGPCNKTALAGMLSSGGKDPATVLILYAVTSGGIKTTGSVAITLKVTELRPGALAAIAIGPLVPPKVTPTLAVPSSNEVAVLALRVAEPEGTLKLTLTPGTGTPLLADTDTTSNPCSRVPAGWIWLLPVAIASFAGITRVRVPRRTVPDF